eukprot:6188371-Pleurochrysis_carterae.AAC.7
MEHRERRRRSAAGSSCPRACARRSRRPTSRASTERCRHCRHSWLRTGRRPRPHARSILSASRAERLHSERAATVTPPLRSIEAREGGGSASGAGNATKATSDKLTKKSEK